MSHLSAVHVAAWASEAAFTVFTDFTVITVHTSQNEGKALTRNKKPAAFTVFADFTVNTSQNEDKHLIRIKNLLHSLLSTISLLTPARMNGHY